MKIYLVGGAVRDALLGLPVTERDWVVVGATSAQLLALGYIQVGHDFPVFLHPKTKEEYALARTERKVGHGYKGFIFEFNQHTTLEQDLVRRDLTINAIAQDENGRLIDPYQGIDDLHQRILRHVSLAFREDPLRVLRVARFAARFHYLGFSIASETYQLMQLISKQGELDYLIPERIWKETEKALKTQDPQVYFKVLHQCGALAILFPELSKQFEQQNNNEMVILADKTLKALKRSTQLTDYTNINELAVRFAILCCQFNDKNMIDSFCCRIKVPKLFHKTALMLANHIKTVHSIEQQDEYSILKLLNAIDVWRHPEHLSQLIFGYKSYFTDDNASLLYNKQADKLTKAYSIAKSVSVQSVISDGFIGKDITEELERRRIIALKMWNKE